MQVGLNSEGYRPEQIPGLPWAQVQLLPEVFHDAQARGGGHLSNHSAVVLEGAVTS